MRFSLQFYSFSLCISLQKCITTGVIKRGLPRLLECSREVEAEVVSNSSIKIHQTWEALFWRHLHYGYANMTTMIKKNQIMLYKIDVHLEEYGFSRC